MPQFSLMYLKLQIAPACPPSPPPSPSEIVLNGHCQSGTNNSHQSPLQGRPLGHKSITEMRDNFWEVWPLLLITSPWPCFFLPSSKTPPFHTSLSGSTSLFSFLEISDDFSGRLASPISLSSHASWPDLPWSAHPSCLLVSLFSLS